MKEYKLTRQAIPHSMSLGLNLTHPGGEAWQDWEIAHTPNVQTDSDKYVYIIWSRDRPTPAGHVLFSWYGDVQDFAGCLQRQLTPEECARLARRLTESTEG